MPKEPTLEEISRMFGIPLETLQGPEQEEQRREFADKQSDEEWIDLEAESVIFYMETKDRESIFKKKTCKMCGEKFLSSYTGVACCGKDCRREYLKSLGMRWSPERTEAERWGGTIPKVIGPSATKILQGMTFPDPPEEEIKETSPPVEDDDIDDIQSLLDLADSVIHEE